jgi:hypothetical protein
MKLVLHPINLSEARAFIRANHRHHKPPLSGLFAIGCAVEGKHAPCGVVIVGRPVARWEDNGWTAEVTRLCSTGEQNVCSMLYRAAWRAAKAMGYKRLITYTLCSEPGTSLVAAGARLLGEAGGGSWSRENRPRVDLHPMQKKLKWEFS